MIRTRLVLALLGWTLLAAPAAAFTMGEMGAASSVHGTLAGTGASPTHAALGAVRHNLPTLQATPTLSDVGGPATAGPATLGRAPAPLHTGGGSGKQGWAAGKEGWKTSTGGGTKGWGTAAAGFGETGATKAWLTASSTGHATGTGKGWAQGGTGR